MLKDTGLHVVRRLLATPRGEDWRRSSMFYTYIKHGDNSYKMMIDEGNCVNIIAKSVVEWLNLTHNHTLLG